MTLKQTPITELMYAVLDGEASHAESRELETRLAADPAAQAEFEEWKRLFEALDAVPKEHVPEGLVASIAAALPQAPGAAGAVSQPFPGRRVLGHTSSGISSRVPSRSVTMTEQSSRRIFAHRKAWLGGGIAAAAAVVVAQIAFDFPLPKDAVGTVIPAQRYRAAQNGSEQVQLGTPAGQATPTGTVPDASRALAERSEAEKTAQRTTEAQKMMVDRVEAEKMAQRTTEAQKMMVDRVEAEKMAQRTTEAQKMMVDRAEAEKMAQRTTEAQKMMVDRTEAEKMAQRTTEAQKMVADRAQVQKSAERTDVQKAAQRAEADRVESQRTMEKSTNRTAQP